MKAIAEAYGTTLQQVRVKIMVWFLTCVTARHIVLQLKAEMKKIGDLGEVAQSRRSKQKTMFPPPPLTVPGVHKSLRQLALSSGKQVCWGLAPHVVF